MRPVLSTPAARTAPPPRRPRLVSIQVLPTLVTLGNVLAGFLALSYVVDAWAKTADVTARDALWVKAAWCVMFGMVCDVLDGRVARLTGAASAFGAELDSLADMITFGVVPALLAKSVAQSEFPHLSTRLTTALAMVYVLGAALRLARYNVESQRVQEPGHVTRVFRGLPSPGAAGVIASLVLLRDAYDAVGVMRVLPWVFLAGTPILGLLMVSRFAFSHVANRYLAGASPPLAILVLVVAIFLAVQHPAEVLAAIFCPYAASGPVLYAARLAFGRPRWADDEADDESDGEADGETDGEADGEDVPPDGADHRGEERPVSGDDVGRS